jgi:hypothetical protein
LAEWLRIFRESRVELVLFPVLAQTELQGRKIHVGSQSVCEFLLSSIDPVFVTLKFLFVIRFSNFGLFEGSFPTVIPPDVQ